MLRDVTDIADKGSLFHNLLIKSFNIFPVVQLVAQFNTKFTPLLHVTDIAGSTPIAQHGSNSTTLSKAL